MSSLCVLNVLLSAWILVLNGIQYQWYQVAEGDITSILELGVTRLSSSSGADASFEIEERITNHGCGLGPESHVFFAVSDEVDGDPSTKWDKITYSIEFWGLTDCWSLFGGSDLGDWPTDFTTGLIEFDKTIDTVLSNNLLYGSWNGEVNFCGAADSSNFWDGTHGDGYKGLIRIEQRRDINELVAGIGSGHSCTGVGTVDSRIHYHDIMVGYKIPTTSPTNQPSASPTKHPTNNPSTRPTAVTANPSRRPTKHPSSSPTSPTKHPSTMPTRKPSISPPTEMPTLSPSRIPTEQHIIGPWPGYELFVRGYNIWKMSTAGNALLDINMHKANIESHTSEGAGCSLSSLEFASSFSSYSEYAESSSASIEAGYSVKVGRAGGSLSNERTETKLHSASSQSYIYSLDLECSLTAASLKALNKVYWSSNFINELRILPDSFDSSDTTAWTDFWNSFGTHLMKTAKLGGRVTGAITVDKCSVEEAYSDSNSYQACLNAAYTGAEAEGCYGESSGSSSVHGAQDAIKKTQIVVKGGSISEFTDVFNSFSDKTDNFQSWINGLTDYPDVIGGHLLEIHKAIRNVINLGSHDLNYVSDVHLTDDEWSAKANALEEAYVHYKDVMANSDTISEQACELDCNEGTLDAIECKCDECSAGLCCGIQTGGGALTQVPQMMVVVLACFAIWNMII
eukprot:53685_1